MPVTSTTAKIYSDLVALVSGAIEQKYVFLGERPKSSTEETPMINFVVVDLPTPIEDLVIGYKKTRLHTDGVFYVFYKAKSNNTLNVNSTGDLIDKIVDRFPYVGDYCSCTKPVLRMKGADEYGYHYATITFDIATKVNVFSNDNS